MERSLPLAAGAALTAAGLILAATVGQVPGGIVCLAGWAVLAVAIHRAGRAGRPDPHPEAGRSDLAA